MFAVRDFVGAAAALVVLTTGPASAQTLRAEGGSASSLTSQIPQLIASNSAPMGYDLRVNVDQTLTRALLKVATGQIDLAPAPVGAYLAMKDGVGPYAQVSEQAVEAADNVRALFAFRAGHIHPLVYANSGIESWEDIEGRRVFIGPPAGTMSEQTTAIIEAITGMTPDEGDYEAVQLEFSAANQAFEDGRFDVFMRTGTMGSAAVDQFGASNDVRLLGVPEEALDTEAWTNYSETPGRATDLAPAGTYENFVNADEDLYLPAYVQMITVNRSMADDTAHDLTRAIFDNLEEIHANNEGMRTLTLDTAFTSLVAPLHPGAIRYFEEAGVEVPDELRPDD